MIADFLELRTIDRVRRQFVAVCNAREAKKRNCQDREFSHFGHLRPHCLLEADIRLVCMLRKLPNPLRRKGRVAYAIARPPACALKGLGYAISGRGKACGAEDMARGGSPHDAPAKRTFGP